jgi:DNA-binding GntR family transcriptional regulator
MVIGGELWFSMIIYGREMGDDSIDRDAGTPPWRQFAAILRARIESGELTGRLPSEHYLAVQYEVSVTLVRKALAQLREEGLIVTERGWGSSVAPRGNGA